MRILGLYFDRPYMRWATLESKGRRVELESLKSFIPNSAEDVKQFYIAERTGSVATGITTLVRSLSFKMSSIPKIEQGMKFQVESLTHLSPEETVFTSRIIPHEKGAEAVVFLASKENLRGELNQWQEFSIAPDLLTAKSQALFRFAKLRCSELSSYVLIDLGSQEWTCVWVENGEIHKTFVIEKGVEALLASLWEDRKKVLFPNEVEGVAKQIDLLQLKAHLNPHLSAMLSEIRNNLNVVLTSFQEDQLPVIFTGRVDAFGNLREYLLEGYTQPVSLGLEECKCAVAIGYALECAQPKNVQFLQNEFIPAKRWRKAGVWAFGLMASSLILSAVFAFFGVIHFQSQKQEIASSLKKIVEKMDKNAEGIEESLRAIQKYDKEAPYLVQAPTVTEVMAWISSHPLMNGLKIADVKYQLVTYPRIGATREPYLAKVDLEFTAESSMVARRFHEELLKGDVLVDPNREINWESLNEGYKVSFYLKNRTPYVR